MIDDNFDVAESTTWMLEGLARETKTVLSGEAALSLVRSWYPDIVVCDLGVPGMDGYKTCLWNRWHFEQWARRLRRVPGLKNAIIIAVARYGGEEDHRKSKEARFDRHPVKPIRRTDLEDLLQSAARGRWRCARRP